MAYVHNIYVGDQIVTRSKKRIFDKFDIRGCYVRLNVSLKTEVLNWLEKTDPKNAKIQENEEEASEPSEPSRASRDDPELSKPSKPRRLSRRNSLAGASLFSVNDNVEEHSSDYLRKIQRPCALQMEPTELNEPTEPIEQVQQVAKKSNVPDLLELTKKPKNPVASNVGVQGANNQVKSSQSGQMMHCHSSNVSAVLNNFDPFRRLPNPPFMIRGRARAQSVDSIRLRRPSLSTIFEHEYECESLEPLVYDGASDSSPTPKISVEEVENGSHAKHAETQKSSNRDMAIMSKWIARSENFEL